MMMINLAMRLMILIKVINYNDHHLEQLLLCHIQNIAEHWLASHLYYDDSDLDREHDFFDDNDDDDYDDDDDNNFGDNDGLQEMMKAMTLSEHLSKIIWLTVAVGEARKADTTGDISWWNDDGEAGSDDGDDDNDDDGGDSSDDGGGDMIN